MRRFGKLSAVMSLLVMMLAVPATAHADVNNFTITDFKSDQTLSRSDAQGTLHIIEQIYVQFTDNNHGILRAIPNDYNSKPLNFHLNTVSSTSGAPTQVSQSFENNNVVLRIGDPNRTVTGAQEYTIDYTVQNVVSFYSDHDELYWDVNGDQWAQPTTNVSVNLHLPSGITLSTDAPQCFAGSYDQNQQKCTTAKTEDGVTASSTNLPPKQTLTYVVGFTKGFFQPETTSEKVKDNLNPLLSLVVLPVAAICGALVWWWRKGRDAKGRGVIIPEYEPPENISALQAGTILDFRADNRDITATIIDLAIKKYIRIHETVVDHKIFKDGLSYELELLNPDTSKLRTYEAYLLSEMFEKQVVGETIKVGETNLRLAKAATALSKQVPKDLKTGGVFVLPSTKYGLTIIGFVAIVATGLAIFFGNKRQENIPEIIFGAGFSVVFVAIMWQFMSARTSKGAELKEQLLGLKLFMEMTEKDRLEKLQGPNAAYANQGKEPKRTVELFEKLLPYAVAMGVEKQWAKQFESLYKAAPNWYASNNTSAFNSIYLANSLNRSFGQAVSMSFTTPSSSGGSGFGGGGFSGGGGGGGGGGGW